MLEPWLVICPVCRKPHIHVPGFDAEKRDCLFCRSPLAVTAGDALPNGSPPPQRPLPFLAKGACTC